MPDLESNSYPPASAALAPAEPAGELDLFPLLLLLRRNIWRIALWGVAGFVLLAIFSLVAKPRFSATITLLVPQPTNTSSTAAALALQAGGLDVLGAGNAVTALYNDMLKSRTLTDRQIQKFDLMKHYHARLIEKAEATLKASTNIVGEREGLLTITVVDGDPKMAAAIANNYFTELDTLNQQIAVSSAALQRRFFEQEMVKEKNQLADAEVALRQTQEQTGVIEPGVQAQAEIGATEGTRLQLRSRQIQLGALRQSETDQNPDIVRLRSEIAGLEGQLGAMQSGGGIATATPANKVPGKTLAYVRNLREVKFHEALFEILARQFETARQQEAKDFSGITVLDPAVVPEHKNWPPRTLYSILGFLGGLVFGVLFTLLRGLYATIMQNPRNRERMQELRSMRRSATAKR